MTYEENNELEQPRDRHACCKWWVWVLLGLVVLLLLWWWLMASRGVSGADHAGGTNERRSTCTPASMSEYQRAQQALDKAWQSWRALPQGYEQRQIWMQRLIGIGNQLARPCVTSREVNLVTVAAHRVSKQLSEAGYI